MDKDARHCPILRAARQRRAVTIGSRLIEPDKHDPALKFPQHLRLLRIRSRTQQCISSNRKERIGAIVRRCEPSNQRVRGLARCSNRLGKQDAEAFYRPAACEGLGPKSYDTVDIQGEKDETRGPVHITRYEPQLKIPLLGFQCDTIVKRSDNDICFCLTDRGYESLIPIRLSWPYEVEIEANAPRPCSVNGSDKLCQQRSVGPAVYPRVLCKGFVRNRNDCNPGVLAGQPIRRSARRANRQSGVRAHRQDWACSFETATPRCWTSRADAENWCG